MRVGDQCVFVRYRRTIRPGGRVFEPGDIIVATQKTGDVSYIFNAVDSERLPVPWLRDTLYHDEFVRLRHAPMISALPGGTSVVAQELGAPA